jgi:hypothetical protein
MISQRTVMAEGRDQFGILEEVECQSPEADTTGLTKKQLTEITKCVP